eukprot:10227240-Alexandrium_andersonii.AAC.1
MIPWVSEVAASDAIANPSAHRELRAACVWGLQQFMSVLDSSGLVMSEHEVLKAHRAARLHLEAYQQL